MLSAAWVKFHEFPLSQTMWLLINDACSREGEKKLWILRNGINSMCKNKIHSVTCPILYKLWSCVMDMLLCHTALYTCCKGYWNNEFIFEFFSFWCRINSILLNHYSERFSQWLCDTFTFKCVSIKTTSPFLRLTTHLSHTTQVSWARTTGWFALSCEGSCFGSSATDKVLLLRTFFQLAFKIKLRSRS